MKILELDYEGQKIRVRAQKLRGRLWYHWQGETHCFDANPQTNVSGGPPKGAQTDCINSPMPGKVIKIFVTLGQEVQVGTPVLVLEAMKMEYTLLAERGGVIAELTCQVGTQVALGQRLVRIADAKPESVS